MSAVEVPKQFATPALREAWLRGYRGQPLTVPRNTDYGRAYGKGARAAIKDKKALDAAKGGAA